MEWSHTAKERGVSERSFSLTCEDRRVPGVAWLPEGAEGPTPLVLIGHGGSGHKREPHIVSLARRLVRHAGIAAAAIDGPAHGDRKPADGSDDSLEERRRRYVGGEITDAMVADWKATLDALQKIPEIGIGPVGYWGLSMGTMFGLPFVAAEPRVRVAVLGLMGSSLANGGRLLRDAADVRCPLLFLQQWNDELIPGDALAKLFDAIASDDKRLHANPGKHAAVPRDEFAYTETFLSERLRDAGA